MKPWLSVVVPVHGGARFLAATLTSAAAERPDGVEFRLYNSLDDGGAARAIADSFAGVLDMVWQDVPHLAPWTAKTNLGVAEARADHVAMLHQDDLWLPGHLVAVQSALAEAPQAALSVAPSRFVGPAGRDLGPWRLPFASGWHQGREFAQTLLVQNSIAIVSPVIARAAWSACGGLDDGLWYTADWDLYLKLAQMSDVLVRHEATTAFRVHPTSLTMTGSRDSSAFHAQLEAVLDRHLPLLSPFPKGLEARARTGIAINRALTVAANGNPIALGGAAARLISLGPVGIARFLKESRLIDRLRPRLRLTFTRKAA